jgi:hypothetical protein
MFSTPPKGGALFVEPLEARIAPTNLIALANDPAVSSNPRYVTFHTPPSAGKLGFVHGTHYGVAGSDVYAMKLTTGDELVIYNSATGFNYSNPFLKCVSGTMIAFFQETSGIQVQSNELVGISLAANTSAEVNGNVNGDIVTNLSAAGTITLGSAGNFKQSIAGLNIVGNVYGSILSGGNINDVTVSGSVKDVLAGTAVNGAIYHFGDPGVATGKLKAAPVPAGKAGGSIDDVSLLTVGKVHAGHGGFGAAGGSVTDLTLQSDTAAFDIFSGVGGNGNAAVKAGGGGNIAGITIQGVVDTTPNTLMLFQAGDGGTNAAGKGGAGGSIADVATSFDTPVPTTGVPQLSAELLEGNIRLQAGDGGKGLRGGAGGSVTDSFLFGSIPDDGVKEANGTANPEIEVLAGTGGAAVSTKAGHGGDGGSIGQVTAENLDPDAAALTSSILIQAGAAGAGGQGGSVQGITLLGTILNVQGGAGGAGRISGGSGGSLNTVTIGNNTQVLSTGTNVLATSVTLDAGIGGAGSNGNGGDGGNISSVGAIDSALTLLVIDGGASGNGGAGRGGVGGDGGSVMGVSINDSGAATLGQVRIRTGAGGNGLLGGGAGGDLGASQSSVQLLGSDFAYTVATGAGGNVLPKGSGAGGAGGDFNTVGISNESFDTTDVTLPAGATGTVTSGAGGSGSTGGDGGDLTSVDLRASYSVTLTAGNGGGGVNHAAGDGGGIFTSAGSSLAGSVTAGAGNAGLTGSKPGAGGPIDAFIAAAAENVTLTSGNGSLGGAGGDISNSGTALDELTQASNAGSLTVTAGHGSSANGIAGAGGSISVFNGSIGQSGTTSFTAGAGGGGTNKSASGAGGSVSAVTLTGTNGTAVNQVFVTFDAGDAGQAGLANKGAAGGSVTNVTISDLATGTIVQHVAAGNGANGLHRGGAGGSISEIHVGAPGDANADIGVRSGLKYGYAIGTAGGLFAGLGGTGPKANGAAGDVTNITANAIASIAGGKGATPHLAGTVDGIFLDGLVATAASANGAFTNFDTANLVGSVIDPTAAAASTYEAGDGLIAAAVITNNRNFRPEAELTLSSGKLVLVDYRQPSPKPVVTPVG